MASVCGLQHIKIPLTVATNASGLWVGNANVLTYLDKGTYLINWNPRPSPVTAGNTINPFQFAVTASARFGTVGAVLLVVSPLCANIGQGANNPVTWSMSNVFTITADATPIYAYLNVEVTGATPWKMNATEDIANMDDIDITRIA
jgi:hypothetical protein